MRSGDKELLERIASQPARPELALWRAHLISAHDCRYVRVDMSLEEFHATLEHKNHPVHTEPT